MGHLSFSIDGYKIKAYTRIDGSTTVSIRHPNLGYFQPWFSIESGKFIKKSRARKPFIWAILEAHPSGMKLLKRIT